MILGDLVFIPYFSHLAKTDPEIVSSLKSIGFKGNIEFLKYLGDLYQENPAAFVEVENYDEKFAFIGIKKQNENGSELCAYFEPNKLNEKQKWIFVGIKTKSAIGNKRKKLAKKSSKSEESVQIDAKENAPINSQKNQIIAENEKTESANSQINSQNNQNEKQDTQANLQNQIDKEEKTNSQNKNFKDELNPIIRERVDEYQRLHCPKEDKGGIVFGRMVNQAILEYYDPGCLNNDEGLLDAICVDGTNDTGLDGICIKVNGKIVSNMEYLNSLIESNQVISEVEIYFIQSKYKSKKAFNSADWSVFSDGIRNFLESNDYMQKNDKVKNWFEIKNKIKDKDCMRYFTRQKIINIRIFYAACSKWNEDNHPDIKGKFEMLKKDIEERDECKCYVVQSPIFLDDDKLISYLKENARYYEANINISDEIRLENSGDLNYEGIAVKLSAKNLLNILIDDEDKTLRKSLFDDNVRDYQGQTKVNAKIKKTLEEDPESFIIRNNGITILVSDAHKNGFSEYTLKNPQIINGCQTCNVIYQVFKDNGDKLDKLEKVEVFARIIKIKSNDYQVTTNVISANNSQNQVYDLVDEISREYHKKLEEFFEDYYEADKSNKIYYERRSKSLLGRLDIKNYQKCTFRDLITSAVSIWFDAPHKARMHESKLLAEYKKDYDIFKDGKYEHNPIIYYAAALLFASYERLIFENEIPSECRKYKAHICCVLGFIFKNNTQKNTLKA